MAGPMTLSATAPTMTAQQVRDAEREAMRTVAEPVLMARAADAIAAECEALLLERHGRTGGCRVVVLAGSGNNGGDALLAGARLHYRGTKTTAVLVAPVAHTMGRGECEAAGAQVIDGASDLSGALHAVETADLVIDGIVGVGAKPGLRAPADALVAAIPEGTIVVAVDLPSGLDVDSGSVAAPHVRADVTVTFTAPKPCLVEQPAAASAGRVIVAQVGVLRR
ncbi:NAD(P)H-hydrate epimerase [Demequina aestuarii]|uniref:NAD(P)H-hydrate epimerase n=1 Tax=Demequina aestuarii TaxID=327095 RepID=UPI000780AC36|nr:NAD(P)H-hydrate epimerase [Demequina aestuarii]